MRQARGQDLSQEDVRCSKVPRLPGTFEIGERFASEFSALSGSSVRT